MLNVPLYSYTNMLAKIVAAFGFSDRPFILLTKFYSYKEKGHWNFEDF